MMKADLIHIARIFDTLEIGSRKGRTREEALLILRKY